MKAKRINEGVQCAGDLGGFNLERTLEVLSKPSWISSDPMVELWQHLAIVCAVRLHILIVTNLLSTLCIPLAVYGFS
jgi:hypothetical protein